MINLHVDEPAVIPLTVSEHFDGGGGGDVPSYTGEYTATPTTSQQTFATSGKKMTANFTVKKIPSEYIIPSGTKNITSNGSGIDVKSYASANVAVPASAVDSGTKSITANGNGQDVVGYAAVDVAVPNTYSAGDEGKVVSNGALVAQTSDTVTTNDTYDTTLINSLTVNVSGGGGVQTFSGNIELIDQQVSSVTIPIDVTGYQNVRLSLLAVETGLVSGGEITRYAEVETPSVFNSMSFVPKYLLNVPEPSFTIKRDDSNYSTITNCGNAQYLQNKYAANMTAVALVLASPITANGIVLPTSNGARFFCLSGAYVKYAYKVEAW